MNTTLKELEKIVKKGAIATNVDLSLFTTIKIAAKAKFLVQTNSIEEIKKLQEYCSQNNIKLFVLGGGSNVIFNGFFNGVVLKILSKDFEILNTGLKPEVEFGAGYSAHLASVKMMELGYSGFEGIYGLPGTLGGAIFQNSKWPKHQYQICDNLVSVKYLDKNLAFVKQQKSKLKFSYGYSSFQDNGAIIIAARFAFTKAPIDEIKKQCEAVMAYRRISQPIGMHTAGCVFKNIDTKTQKKHNFPTGSAGYFIDKSGLKKTKIGEMEISDVHANFFINTSNATIKDYVKLVSLVKTKVKSCFGIALKEEVRIIE